MSNSILHWKEIMKIIAKLLYYQEISRIRAMHIQLQFMAHKSRYLADHLARAIHFGRQSKKIIMHIMMNI